MSCAIICILTWWCWHDYQGRYKQSLFKAFKRTVDEGRFKMVIVDASNIRVEDFKEYWAAGQARTTELSCAMPQHMLI